MPATFAWKLLSTNSIIGSLPVRLTRYSPPRYSTKISSVKSVRRIASSAVSIARKYRCFRTFMSSASDNCCKLYGIFAFPLRIGLDKFSDLFGGGRHGRSGVAAFAQLDRVPARIDHDDHGPAALERDAQGFEVACRVLDALHRVGRVRADRDRLVIAARRLLLALQDVDLGVRYREVEPEARDGLLQL